MVMTDPIADMLIRIKNGFLAKKRVVRVPYSRIKQVIAKILVKEGFLAKQKMVKVSRVKKDLELTLKYEGQKPALTEIKRVSKPGLRVYARADKVPRVRFGPGLTILSTSAGMMTAQEAKKKNLGGEIICQVW